MKFRIRCVGKVLLAVVAIGVLGWLVMSLWNWVIPALFVGAARSTSRMRWACWP